MNGLEWKLSEDSVRLQIDGRPFFSDSVDHWRNAFVRLLDLTEESAIEFVERAAIERTKDPRSDLIAILARSWITSLGGSVAQPPAALPWLTTRNDSPSWLTDRVRDSSEFGIAYDETASHAWLADRSTGSPATVEEVEYEEEYFEGGLAEVGYGSYLAQSAWRLEKGARQCREIAALRQYSGLSTSGLSVLDIGSGYGFFRKACADLGWSSDGIEVSRHAASVCSQLFGLDTHVTELDDFVQQNVGRYDIVVMWDFIEHVERPIEALKLAGTALGIGGSLFIRTPNLRAKEFTIFGSDYHSLKREHLNLFSPQSLGYATSLAGLTPSVSLTSSHLLSGFVEAETATWAVNLEGSDILAVAHK